MPFLAEAPGVVKLEVFNPPGLPIVTQIS